MNAPLIQPQKVQRTTKELVWNYYCIWKWFIVERIFLVYITAQRKMKLEMGKSCNALIEARLPALIHYFFFRLILWYRHHSSHNIFGQLHKNFALYACSWLCMCIAMCTCSKKCKILLNWPWVIDNWGWAGLL